MQVLAFFLDGLKRNGYHFPPDYINLSFQFVTENFDDEGLDLELWTPSDWQPSPAFVDRLSSPHLRGLAKRINGLFRDLSRRIKDDVRDNPGLYSIIYVPNGFLVPGGE